MKRSTCSTQSIYAVDSDVIALASCDNAHALRHHRTARGAGARHCVWGRGEQSCAGTCRRFTSQQAAWSSGPFSSQTHGSPWFFAIYYLFMLLINFSQLHTVNFINGNKWIKWIKSYETVIFCKNVKFSDPFITKKGCRGPLVDHFFKWEMRELLEWHCIMAINCIDWH